MEAAEHPSPQHPLVPFCPFEFVMWAEGVASRFGSKMCWSNLPWFV